MAHICVFDWDDTALITTTLLKEMVRQNLDVRSVNISREMTISFNIIDEKMSELFLYMSKYFHLYIVTNAEEGWVEMTAKRFLPKTLKTIKSLKIGVISAAEMSKRETSDLIEWKYRAMMHIIKKYDEGISLFVSIGDSECEKEASIRIGRENRGSMTVKTVKMKSEPTPQELIHQQKLMGVSLSYLLFDHGSSGLIFLYNGVAK